MDLFEIDVVGQLSQREPLFNIAPTQKAPIIFRADDGVQIQAFKWGLVPSWAKDQAGAAKMINARVETVGDRPAYRAAFKRRRCLIPMSGYYEWRGDKKGQKQPFFISHPLGELILCAGLWEVWMPKDDPGAEWLRTFTMITGKPGKVSGDIHDRQPVILPAEGWGEWLDGSPEEAQHVLMVAPEADLTYYPVSKAVGSPRNKGAELIEPITVEQ